MLTIAVRGIRDNPFRFIATGLAIILGIGFFVGTSVLTTSVNQSLNDGVAQAFSHVDAAVQSTTSIQVGSIKIRPRISPDILPTLRALPDVAAATGFVNGYAQVVGTNGKVLSGGTPSAFNWISEPELNPLTIVAGHAPTAADEVVVDQGSLADAGLHLGEKVRLLPMPASEPFVLVGVMAYKNGSGSGGQRMVALSDAGAQRVFATTEVNQIFVAGHHGIAPSALVASLDHVLPKGQQAETGQQFRKDLEDALGTITNFIRLVLRVFAVVALVVGAFIIYNTFSITVAQRIREMALLRAIGATRGRVGRRGTRRLVPRSAVRHTPRVAGAHALQCGGHTARHRCGPAGRRPGLGCHPRHDHHGAGRRHSGTAGRPHTTDRRTARRRHRRGRFVPSALRCGDRSGRRWRGGRRR
jgi:putative ABC transport system permease protein